MTQMSDESVYLDVRDIISLLVSDFPFSMPIVKMDIGFCSDKLIKTNGRAIFINPQKWSALPLNKKEGLLLHEWLHIAFLHILRGKDKDIRVWTDACDFLVDGHIIKNHYSENISLPDGFLYDEAFNDLSADEIYTILLNKTDNAVKNDQPRGFKSKNVQVMKSFGNYNSAEDAISAAIKGSELPGFSGDLMDDNAGGDNFEDLKYEIIAASEYSEKIMGHLPSYYSSIISEMRKGKAPWKKILASIIRELLYFGNNRSYAKPKKWSWQYGFALPGEIGKKDPKLVVIYDTSGSMSEEEFIKINGELDIILQGVKSVTVLTCDAKVHEQVKIKNINDIIKEHKIKFFGRGGTDFQPALIQAAKLKPDLVIYFTDGYGKFGERPKKLKNLLWVINNDKVKPPFGKYITI